jgi:biopolymer transport protein ExbD
MQAFAEHRKRKELTPMSMKADTEGKAYDDINVTPMVDLYLVLLLIFIIMTTAGLQGLKVNLPKESAATSQAKKKIQAITVTNDGKIFLNTVPVTLAELEQHLTQAKGADARFSRRRPRRQQGPVPGHHGCAQRLRETRHHPGGPGHQTAQGPLFRDAGNGSFVPGRCVGARSGHPAQRCQRRAGRFASLARSASRP